MTFHEACLALGLSRSSFQRRMRSGTIKSKKIGEGKFAPLEFSFADLGLKEPETPPLAAPQSDDLPKADTTAPPETAPAVNVEIPADYGHSLELDRLDEWVSGALTEARKFWLLPARTDGRGVPTNQPHKDSSTMPSPENWARYERAGMILLARTASRYVETPQLSKPFGYWPSDPAIKNHNSKVASLGQAETTEDYQEWTRKLK